MTMNARQAEFWQRLESFEIDDPGIALPFRERLARENGWTSEFAARVMDEYRRYILLMAHAGHPVTPSDHVDQAWHLHLTYTRSYWDRLCKDLIGRPLHHEPTKGGAAESAKFDGWYQKTLDSYASLFGTPPPADIWPPPAIRFGVDPRCVRVNTDRNWIVSKHRVKRASLGAGVIAAFAAAAAGCGVLLGDGNAILLIVILTVVISGLLLAIAARKQRRQIRRDNGHTSGCGGAAMWPASGCSSSRDSRDDSTGHDSSPGDSGSGSSGCGGGGGGD